MNINKKGFTLAELLTVVAVLAIVVMISIPLITGRIESARAATCKTNRQALINGTTTASMTDKIDWTKEYSAGSVEPIIVYLINQGYITEAPSCSSGGQIYISDVTKDTIYFKCSFHDDGVEPGEDGPTILLDKKVSDLQDAVKKSMEAANQKDGTSNDNVIKAFVGSEFAQKMVKVDTGSILTKKEIDRIATILVSEGIWDNKDKVILSLEKIRDNQVYLVPYYAAQAKSTIVYLVDESNYKEMRPPDSEGGGRTHRPTNLICYKNKWYIKVAKDTNNTIKTEYCLTAFTDTNDEEIMKILSNQTLDPTAGGWIAINR